MLTEDSTFLSYWLNWRCMLCSIIVLAPIVIAWFIIWRYEIFGLLKAGRGDIRQDVDYALNDDDVWRPCLKEIHPAWLLAFRVVAFSLALATLVGKIASSGAGIFFFYTQWTFTLVTIYFGFGSLLSAYGLYQHHKTSSHDFEGHDVRIDPEQGYRMPLIRGKSKNLQRKALTSEEKCLSQAACVSSYLFQIIFQVNGGAVMLTDCIYWSIIFPFLTIKDYDLNLMTVNMHTLNVILLVGDTALNSLRFPWFRISYFILWTSTYVIFQWIVHLCLPIWWPYPFLDLSSPYAPLWYMSLAFLHLPCYGLFSLIVKTKYYLLSKWCSQSC